MFVLITFPFFEIFLGFSFKHLFSNDLDVLLLMLCTSFKELLVAKIKNINKKRKENGNYFFFKRKVFPFSPIITLMQGKPAGNHHGAERDGGGKNQDRKALVVLQ